MTPKTEKETYKELEELETTIDKHSYMNFSVGRIGLKKALQQADRRGYERCEKENGVSEFKKRKELEMLNWKLQQERDELKAENEKLKRKYRYMGGQSNLISSQGLSRRSAERSCKERTRMTQKAGYIENLVTGGRATLVEQQEKGGEPTCCEVFKEANQLLKPKAISTMRHSCRAGKRLCSECKTELSNYYHRVSK